jgi:hypothetical protein
MNYQLLQIPPTNYQLDQNRAFNYQSYTFSPLPSVRGVILAATGAGESQQRDLTVEVSANAAIPHGLHHIRLWGAKARGPCRRHMTDWTTTTTSRDRIALLFSQPTSLKKPQRSGKAKTSTHC